jgi:hypothetical protein
MRKIIIQNEKGLMSKQGGHNSVVQPSYSDQKYEVNVCLKGETKLHIQRPLSSSLNKNLGSSRVNCIQRRLVSSLSTTSPCAAYSKLDPWFITGFADGESYFSISIVKSPRLKLG